MAAQDFYIKQGDLLPEIQGICKDEDTDLAIDLTAATGVKFRMFKPGSATPKIDAVGSFVDKANGVVKYSWQGTDTDTKGVYDAEFEVTFGAGTLTFPNWTHLKVKVTAEVG